MALLAAASAVPVVQAQPAPPTEGQVLGAELRYEAFTGCPDRDSFVKSLEARSRGVAAGMAQHLEVRLRPLSTRPRNVDVGGADRVEGSITITGRDGARSARRIVAPTCAEASDALALIGALALQGLDVEEATPASGNETAVPRKKTTAKTTRRPAAGSTRAAQGDATGTSRAIEVGTLGEGTGPVTGTEAATEAWTDVVDVTEAPTGSQTPVADELEAQTEVVGEPIAVADEPDTKTEKREGDVALAGRANPPRAHVLLGGGVSSGVLPALQPLLELSLHLEGGAPGAVLLSAQADVRLPSSQTRSSEAGVVTFSWWSGLLSLCLGARGTELSFSGCALVEGGTLTGSATATERPQEKRRAWVALGPGLTLAYDAFAPLRLQLRAQTLAPFTRYRFELPRDTAIHQPAGLELRASLGVGLRLW